MKITKKDCKTSNFRRQYGKNQAQKVYGGRKSKEKPLTMCMTKLLMQKTSMFNVR